MEIEYSVKFIKQLKKAPKNIQISVRERLGMFVSDQFGPLLNNHALKGKYEGDRSININGDWRAVYQSVNQGTTAYFIALGTHGQLYK